MENISKSLFKYYTDKKGKGILNKHAIRGDHWKNHRNNNNRNSEEKKFSFKKEKKKINENKKWNH